MQPAHGSGRRRTHKNAEVLSPSSSPLYTAAMAVVLSVFLGLPPAVDAFAFRSGPTTTAAATAAAAASRRLSTTTIAARGSYHDDEAFSLCLMTMAHRLQQPGAAAPATTTTRGRQFTFGGTGCRSTAAAEAAAALGENPEGTAASAAPADEQQAAAGGGDGGGVSSSSMTKKKAVMELTSELKRFGNLRMWRQALDAFNGAKRDGLPVTTSVYTHVIHALSRGGRYKEAIELLEEMIASGDSGSAAGKNTRPMVVSYNAAITACARANKCDRALELFETMQTRSNLKPDIYSYGAAMLAVAKAARADKALELLDEMRAVGVAADPICLKLAMEACQNQGAWKQAGEIIKQVRAMDESLSPAIMTSLFTLAIGSCVRQGAWEQALEYLTDIRLASGGQLPRAPAFAAVASACARGGQVTRARALIAELAAGGEDGNRPNLDCYNAILEGCSLIGDWEGAVTVLKVDIPEAGLKPDTKGYNMAIMGCGHAGKWESALSLLNEQRSGKAPTAPPDRESFNAALAACGRAGVVWPTMLLLDAMRAEARRNARVRPNAPSYAGALQACRLAGDSKSALYMLADMKKEKIRPNQRCMMEAAGACIASGEHLKAAELVEEMARDRIKTSEGARLALRASFDGLCGEGLDRCRAALDMLDETAKEAGWGAGGGE